MTYPLFGPPIPFGAGQRTEPEPAECSSCEFNDCTECTVRLLSPEGSCCCGDLR